MDCRDQRPSSRPTKKSDKGRQIETSEPANDWKFCCPDGQVFRVFERFGFFHRMFGSKHPLLVVLSSESTMARPFSGDNMPVTGSRFRRRRCHWCRLGRPWIHNLGGGGENRFSADWLKKFSSAAKTSKMKSFVIIAALLVALKVKAQSWQDVSLNAFTNAAIVWQVPADQMPKHLWVYQRILPHVFSAAVLTNAIVLSSLQSRGFPRSTTNDFRILPKMPENWPGPIPVIFEIRPCDASLSYSIPNWSPISERKVPDGDTIFRMARKDASLLGFEPSRLEHGRIYKHFCDTDEAGNNFCGRGVFFPRYLDGISFFSTADDSEFTEGFSIEFGEDGKIQRFFVRWSELERLRDERTASEDDILRCIRAHKAIIMPNFQPNDFAWLKILAETRKLRITKITPYYGESVFGEVPTNDVPYGFATPFAELDAVADLDHSNMPVKLLSPILFFDVQRVLARRMPKSVQAEKNQSQTR